MNEWILFSQVSIDFAPAHLINFNKDTYYGVGVNAFAQIEFFIANRLGRLPA
jgi:hypothetical protein